MSSIGFIAIGAAISALACAGAAIGMSLATSKSVESIARQPEAFSKINSALLFGLIMMETTAIYALLVAVLLIFVIGAPSLG